MFEILSKDRNCGALTKITPFLNRKNPASFYIDGCHRCTAQKDFGGCTYWPNVNLQDDLGCRALSQIASSGFELLIQFLYDAFLALRDRLLFAPKPFGHVCQASRSMELFANEMKERYRLPPSEAKIRWIDQDAQDREQKMP